MTAKEKELGEERILYVKNLKLISPETALRLGIVTEGPVFISPFAKESRCECGVLYKPVVYQSGSITSADHIHKDSKSGGIYYMAMRQQDFKEYAECGWLAVLYPLGDTFSSTEMTSLGALTNFHSERSIVQEIKAYCGCFNEIREGLVLVSQYNPSILFPACDRDKGQYGSSSPRFSFKITEDGRMLFSQI